MKYSKLIVVYLLCLLGWGVIAGNLQAQERSSFRPDDPMKVSTKYRLQPTDVLQFEVYQEPELKRQIRVEGDGTIVLPLIGKVAIGGVTISEAQEHIQYLYNKDYLVNPQVNLLILEYSPRKVQVLGQVNRAGVVVIPPEENMTLTEAISGANGFNLRANDKAVQIRRKNEKGETQVIEINVKEILRNPRAKDPEIFDGDTVFVPESTF